MDIRRISSDADLPIPLDELKLDLRIDDDDGDDTLDRMERTALELIEKRSGYIILPGIFEVLFNVGECLEVQRAPLSQVTEIAALTGKNEWTDLDVNDFRVLQSENSFRILTYPEFVCPTFYAAEGAIRVRFRAGYGLDPISGESEGGETMELPALLKGIAIALTGHFYQNRELFEADKLTEIESTAGGLLNSIRRFW